MPTEVISFVGSASAWAALGAPLQSSRYGNRTYTTIALWETAFGGATSFNLVDNKHGG